MRYDTTWHRRQVLAALGAGAVGASAGAGTASAHGQEQAENSIKIRYPDCETVRITGAQVLNERGYFARFSGRCLTAGGRRAGLGYRVDPADFEFHHEEDIAEAVLDHYSEYDPVGAIAGTVRVYCCGPPVSGARQVAWKENPDEDDCWSEVLAAADE